MLPEGVSQGPEPRRRETRGPPPPAFCPTRSGPESCWMRVLCPGQTRGEVVLTASPLSSQTREGRRAEVRGPADQDAGLPGSWRRGRGARGRCPPPGVSGTRTCHRSCHVWCAIRPAPPRPRVPKRASVPGTVPYHPGTRGEPDCSEVDVPEGTVQRLSWLSPVRAGWTHGVSHREKVTGAFPPRLTQRRGVFPASPFSCLQLNVSMC